MYDVVIPSLYEKDAEYLALCVESLRASGFDRQIIVVTNGTPVQPSLKHIKGISTHLHTRDQGQCIAVNVGAQLVNSEYMLISNADMYYAPGWDKNLRFDYPVFSPNLVEPTNNNGSALPFMKLDAGFTLDEFNKDKVDNFIRICGDIRSGKLLTGAFLTGSSHQPLGEETGFNFPVFIKKDMWNLIEGYDTAFDPWGSGSDTDLQMKVELAGVMPMRLRDVLVYHFSNKSGTFDGTHQDYWQNNWDYLQEKWGFNRDEAGSDTWYCKNMIMREKLKYHPKWEGQYDIDNTK